MGAAAALAACGGEPAADRVDPLRNPQDTVWDGVAPDTFRVRFETSRGDVVVEAVRAWAPIGTDRFYNLARHGFYDGQRLFRIVPGFIAQFGIPGDPRVTAVWHDRATPDDPVRQSNLRGYVAYAMTGPDTRTTQLFINTADNARLDEQGFAPFARVVRGMDVVDRWYGGYGESAGGGMRAGQQGPLLLGGNAYLDEAYPDLDRIARVVVEQP